MYDPRHIYNFLIKFHTIQGNVDGSSSRSRMACYIKIRESDIVEEFDVSFAFQYKEAEEWKE